LRRRTADRSPLGYCVSSVQRYSRRFTSCLRFAHFWSRIPRSISNSICPTVMPISSAKASISPFGSASSGGWPISVALYSRHRIISPSMGDRRYPGILPGTNALSARRRTTAMRGTVPDRVGRQTGLHQVSYQHPYVVIDRLSGLLGQFKPDGLARLLLPHRCTDRLKYPLGATSSTLRAKTSQPRSLLSMARLNITKSRVRPSTCSLVRIDQTCFGRSGGFAPVSLPLFQDRRLDVIGTAFSVSCMVILLSY